MDTQANESSFLSRRWPDLVIIGWVSLVLVLLALTSIGPVVKDYGDYQRAAAYERVLQEIESQKATTAETESTVAE